MFQIAAFHFQTRRTSVPCCYQSQWYIAVCLALLRFLSECASSLSIHTLEENSRSIRNLGVWSSLGLESSGCCRIGSMPWIVVRHSLFCTDDTLEMDSWRISNSHVRLHLLEPWTHILFYRACSHHCYLNIGLEVSRLTILLAIPYDLEMTTKLLW